MISSEKQKLRRLMRQRLAAMSGEQRASASQSLSEKLASIPEIRDCVLFGYAPLPSEPDVLATVVRLVREIALPRMAGERLTFHSVPNPHSLLPGDFGIPEPDAQLPEVAISSAQVVLVPGLAFDGFGNRLGRGKGYYDRLLQALPAGCLTLGICFACQVVEEIPIESHDQRVDRVVSG